MKESVIIYTMGKVGSTTLQKVLKKNGTFKQVYHIHTLNEAKINRLNEEYKKIGKKYTGLIDQTLGAIEYNKLTEKPLIVSGVRDFFSRMVSDFFQNAKRYDLYWGGDLFNNDGSYNIPEILKYLNNKVDTIDFSKDYVFSWFNNEVKTYFDFDVFSVPFDKEKGYIIADLPKCKLLLYRMESLDDCMIPMLKEFFDIELMDANVFANTSKSKDYHNDYLTVKKELVISESIRNLYENSEYFRHFYA